MISHQKFVKPSSRTPGLDNDTYLGQAQQEESDMRDFHGLQSAMLRLVLPSTNTAKGCRNMTSAGSRGTCPTVFVWPRVIRY